MTDNGLRAFRDRAAEVRSQIHTISSKRGRITKTRVVTSDAMGVMPDQVDHANNEAKRLGWPVRYQPDGLAEFASERDKKDVAKRFGYEHD
jgi:hypothetical protein